MPLSIKSATSSVTFGDETPLLAMKNGTFEAYVVFNVAPNPVILASIAPPFDLSATNSFRVPSAPVFTPKMTLSNPTVAIYFLSF